MSDGLDARSLVDAAEQAAGARDYGRAESLLRDAALLQEMHLGPAHPDLANTLNNLGVVCEVTGKLAEAEDFYRRAFGIATAALPADHPFVVTSGRNLRAFCDAHGKAVELSPASPPASTLSEPVAPPFPAQPAESPRQPAPPPVADMARGIPATPLPAVVVAPQVAKSAQTSARKATAFRPFTLAVVAVSALVLAALVMLVSGQSRAAKGERELQSDSGRTTQTDKAEASTRAAAGKAAARASTASSTAATSDSAAVASGAVASEAVASTSRDRRQGETGDSSARVPVPAVAAAKSESAGGAAGKNAKAAASSLQVADAQLCRSLMTAGTAGTSGGWRCDPAAAPIRPGQLFYYTRITSASDATVEHRWYRGSELRQAVQLHIRANAGGYRTYSRRTVDNAGTGEWRVEVRGNDGTLLHEERFVVR